MKLKPASHNHQTILQVNGPLTVMCYSGFNALKYVFPDKFCFLSVVGYDLFMFLTSNVHIINMC